MIRLTRITRADDPLLERLVPLYIESFPEAERRDIRQLEQLLTEAPEMYWNAIFDGDELCGLASYWDLGDFYYMEHLAVFPAMRNRKIGQRVLDYWREQLPKLRILEVEPAEEEMARRRIGFYERNGYKVVYKDYIQPSYRADEPACSLWIMASAPHPNIEAYAQKIQEKIYREPLRFLHES